MRSSPILIANWKMRLRDAEALDIARELAHDVLGAAELVLCPSFTALPPIAEALRGSPLVLGAQDCAHEQRGSLTGEVSAEDLRAIGCRYVIVGHSERRQQLGEVDALIAAKLRVALGAGLHPILCVGETLEQRRAGQLHAVLREQLRSALAGFELVGTQRLCIAYEPVWAIGTGQAATPQDAGQAHHAIIEFARETLGDGGSQRLRVLYGGSVTPENLAAFLGQDDVHGVLVGTASQSAEGLRKLIAALP